ncbi:hypothetical protein M422DRAFT_264077 [Sphaerobolus stellatus SS14]|uniref:Reverse transcriptase zinc-binding domain-containing protein n=1 Tax=Sphaerobolus stellatus (strain SS14) TaxID=990650 RepID=A0A0C9UXE9_SPHS4|nr:hypothetical protein M422DRAFT_264077 [Sphaerobolus stellatus SS14]
MSRQVGSLPVHEGRMLYTTRVDPHLTSGAEVVIDVVKTALQRLEVYRRLDLTLRYLHHVLLPSQSLFVRAAFDECVRLYSANKASWLGDLIHSLRHLPMPMILPPTGLTPTVIDNVRKDLQQSMAQSLAASISGSNKLVLLQYRVERNNEGRLIFRANPQGEHVMVKNPKHRIALIRLLFSSHPLVIEHLEWAERRRQPIHHHLRLCRLCQLEVENEVHAVLTCTSHEPIVIARTRFLSQLPSLGTGIPTRSPPS